jgi:iron-sulfur cluster assembly accessory protein
MITVTETAENEINMVLAESKEPYLRISVQGGGCSGFNYVFDFSQSKEEDDFEFGKVLVDSMSMQYLQGAKVDFVEDIMGSSFNIVNPNAQTKCGCGSSFSI